MHKIKRFHIYFMLLIGLVVHLTALDYVKIFDVKPDLLLILVVFAGLFSSWRRGLEAGLAAGIFKDLFTTDLFWTNTFILGIAGFLAGILSVKFFKESKTTQVLFVFFLGLLSLSVHFAVSDLFASSPRLYLSDYLFFFIIPASAYTALLSIPIFSRLVTFYNLGEEDEDLL